MEHVQEGNLKISISYILCMTPGTQTESCNTALSFRTNRLSISRSLVYALVLLNPEIE